MDNGKGKFITKRIKVFGIVQGVGFRPLVYRIAKNINAAGTVRNIGGYVEIILQTTEDKSYEFINELKAGSGTGYEIVKLEVEEFLMSDYQDFTIIGSGEDGEISIIPPDLPVCPECGKELYSQDDRRFHNPFISCMSCGPRYTIIEEMPYDRDNTSMTDFGMCSQCEGEYTSPEDRRFHAQTISCNDCGPYLIYKENNKTVRKRNTETKYDYNNLKSEELKQEGNNDKASPVQADYLKDQVATQDSLYNDEALNKAVNILKSGGIIAVKGIGGYHLVCSPFIEETVQNLRKLKGREEKPFAVMFETMASIKAYCLVSEEEEALLKTKSRPIVLLYMNKDTMAPSTNKGSIYCGAFLPYTPLQLLLTGQCGPLIMTSANLSDQPITREDNDMLSLQSPYLDGVLYNKRRIIRSVDDSVAKVIDGKPQLIRRSRGYVPYPVFLKQDNIKNTPSDGKEHATEGIKHADDIRHIEDDKKKASVKNSKNPMIFAAGGDLKAAFCLYQNGSAVVSQYFGDLGELSVMEEYKKAYADLSRLLKISPEYAVCDMHPNYYSSEFARNLDIPLIQVQHHHAHVASVMAEHDLMGKVIGVSFDGTGYGIDGSIWGGEFLICEGADFIRAGHLKYALMLGGDESMKDAKKTATCFLLNANLDKYVADERKGVISAALHHKVNTVNTSSMGRLFDAVASILGIAQENRYEGECAVFLEREAVLAKKAGKEQEEIHFAIHEESGIIELDPKPVLEALCRLRDNKDTGSLALGFHYALAEAATTICERLRKLYGSNTVALSGGVFQNTVLSEQMLSLLRQRGFKVYVNLAVPPNDGGICLGQTYIALQKLI